MRQAQFRKYGKGNFIAKLASDIKGIILLMKSASMIKNGKALEVMTAHMR